VVVPKNTTAEIPFVTPILVDGATITTDLAFVSYTDETWILGVLSSTMHRVWAEAVSGGLGSGIRYSSQITYNAFPLPVLTQRQEVELRVSSENILIAREACYPATIAELYDPDHMPPDLRAAHERNDEVLERIYIGRRFRNDTERLEKLFELYSKMVASPARAR
jgi:hypothetical protein